MNIPENLETVTPRIPGYTIKSIVGHGGFATVYLAQQHNLQRDVALKVMSPILANDPNVCSRFIREARDTAAVCNHPNIITVHDVGQTESLYYISMQYLQGPTLKQLIDSVSRLPSPEVILNQLAGALEYIHQKGFVHRDIKPANVLFNDSNDAVLTDFGIATLESHTTQFTHDGNIIGTAMYMSPEQCRADPAIDARSDLYSLGVMFFEILAGHPPFEAADPMALMLKHVNEPIPRLPTEHKHYQAIIDMLMAKAVEQRFQSATDLLQAIALLTESRHKKNLKLSPSPRSVHAQQDEKDTPTSTVLLVATVMLILLTGLLLFLNAQPQVVLPLEDLRCPVLTQAQSDERDALLELATMHEAIGRLIHPPGANALEAYSLALDIDPCNKLILKSMEKIRSD